MIIALYARIRKLEAENAAIESVRVSITSDLAKLKARLAEATDSRSLSRRIEALSESLNNAKLATNQAVRDARATELADVRADLVRARNDVEWLHDALAEQIGSLNHYKKTRADLAATSEARSLAKVALERELTGEREKVAALTDRSVALREALVRSDERWAKASSDHRAEIGRRHSLRTRLRWARKFFEADYVDFLIEELS